MPTIPELALRPSDVTTFGTSTALFFQALSEAKTSRQLVALLDVLDHVWQSGTSWLPVLPVCPVIDDHVLPDTHLQSMYLVFHLLVLSPALPRLRESYVHILVTPTGRLKVPRFNCGKMYGGQAGTQGCAAQKIFPKHARSIHCRPSSGLAKHGHSTTLQYCPVM